MLESWREELYHSGVGVCFVDEWTGKLYHHGVKGQKWGVRNGPPYPLDDSDRSTGVKDGKKKAKKYTPADDDVKYVIDFWKSQDALTQTKLMDAYERGHEYDKQDLAELTKLRSDILSANPIVAEVRGIKYFKGRGMVIDGDPAKAAVANLNDTIERVSDRIQFWDCVLDELKKAPRT